MNYLQQLLEFLDPQEIETANFITLEDINEDGEYQMAESTESVEGKDLTGGTAEVDELPDGIRPKIFKADMVIDKRTKKEQPKLIYDKKRKCYIAKKKK